MIQWVEFLSAVSCVYDTRKNGDCQVFFGGWRDPHHKGRAVHHTTSKGFFDCAATQGFYPVRMDRCPTLFVAVVDADVTSSSRAAFAAIGTHGLCVDGAGFAVLLVEGDAEEAAFGGFDLFLQLFLIHGSIVTGG